MLLSHPAHRRTYVAAVAVILGMLAMLVSARPAAAVEALLVTELTGAAEVDDGGNPDQGDLDGSGSAYLDIDSEAGELCYGISVQDIDQATAAHVHQAEAGVNGGIVIPLTAPDATGVVEDCIAVDPALLKAIVANPAGYYVNVHNEEFPNGALRGQLEVAPAGGGECTLFGSVDDGEPSTSLTVGLDDRVLVFGNFIGDADVEFTYLHEGVFVFGDTITANADGYVELLFGFDAGDEGSWVFEAVVPETECAASIEVTVEGAAAPATPAPATPVPALPDTSVSTGGSSSIGAAALLTLALLGSVSVVMIVARRRA